MTELIAVSVLVVGGFIWLFIVKPPRAVTVIGLALMGSIAGYIVGFIVGAFQYSLLDGPTTGYLTSALIGGGVGLVLGAALGLALARKAQPVTSSQAWALRALAVGALLAGLVTRRFEASMVMPGGGGMRLLAGLQRITLVDASLVAVLLLIVAGWSAGRPQRASDDGGLSSLGMVGLACGLLAWVGFLLVAWNEPTPAERHQAKVLHQANNLTLQRLTPAANRYHDTHGTFPPDVATRPATGGQVAS